VNLNGSPRDRFAELVIVVACAAGGWWLIAKPFYNRAETADRILEETRTSLEETTAIRADNPDRAAEVMAIVARWNAAHADPLLVGGMIQHAADDAGVSIDRVSPADDDTTTPLGSIDVSTRRYEVITTGSARELLTFIDAIDRHPLAAVQSFEFAPGESEGSVIGLVHVSVSRIALVDAPADRGNQ